MECICMYRNARVDIITRHDTLMLSFIANACRQPFITALHLCMATFSEANERVTNFVIYVNGCGCYKLRIT